MSGFKVTGHANHGRHGKDIVCSAVSILTQTAVLGLGNVAKVDVRYEMNAGHLLCELPSILSDEQKIQCAAILDTMYVGLINLQQTYQKYIDIVEKEEV